MYADRKLTEAKHRGPSRKHSIFESMLLLLICLKLNKIKFHTIKLNKCHEKLL